MAKKCQMRSPLLAPDIQNHPFGWFFVFVFFVVWAIEIIFPCVGIKSCILYGTYICIEIQLIMAHLLASPKYIPKGETMKKIAILTSVLALAACGGGGGGGGGAQLPPLPPVMLENGNSTTTVARNVNDINYQVYKKLTSNTELIAAHSPFRDASTESAKYTKSLKLFDEMVATLHAWNLAAKLDPANGAKKYAQENYEKAHQALQVLGATSTELGAYTPGNYEKLADYFTNPANMLNNDRDTLDTRIHMWRNSQGTQAKLATNFGQDFISSLKGDATTTGDAILTFNDSGKLTEVNIKKSDRVQRDYTVDENGKITKLTETTASPSGRLGIPMILPTPDSSRVATFGNVVGLQYSDFGYLTHSPASATTTAGGTSLADGWTFAGGYQIMKREPQSAGEFKGVAIAVIKNSQGDMMETATRDANVYVDPSSSETTLTANFTHAANPWYDVKLSNDDVRMYDNGANIPEQFRVKISETSDIPDHDKNYLVTQAFGEGVDPTEMVATGAVMGMTSATDDVNKIDAHFSFGGKFEQ